MKMTFLLMTLERSGGVRVTTEIINQLSDLGHDCSVIVPSQKEFPFQLRDKVQVVHVNNNIKNIKFSIIFSVFKFAFSVSKETEIIVSSYYLTAYSSLIAKIFIPKSKLFYIVQGYEPNYFKQEGKTQWLSYLLAKLSYRLPLKRSAISKWLAELVRQNGNINDIPVINNGIDSTLFFLQKKEKNCGNVLMTIANRRPNRGFFDFCKSANLLWEKRKDFSILIVGSDLNIPIQLNMPYTFITPVNDVELIECYHKSSVFVTCSHEEGFGLTPLESMSCGTPVVCTDCGGINDYAINGHNCLIVKPKDVVQIADAIDILLDDDMMKISYIHNGRKTAENFDWSIIGEKYDAYFTETNIK